jgi:hypothetical protein
MQMPDTLSPRQKAALAPEGPPVLKAEKPFAAGGSIEMRLDGGSYVVRSVPEHSAGIRVTFPDNAGDAVADLATSGNHATLAIRNTPHKAFRATIEVPPSAELTVHLAGGDLQVSAISGSKNIDCKAGNVGISVPDAKEYGMVDAAVQVGNLDAGPFGGTGSGLERHLTWSGPGKYALHVSLGAGDLELKR